MGPAEAATRAQENGSVLVFNAHTLALTGELRPPHFPLRDVHDAALIDGKLFVACSYDNLIAVFDFATGRWEKWYPAADLKARDCDANHFNTIAVHDNRIILLAHNNGPSQLFFYDRRSLDLCKVIRLGKWAHDIFRVGGEIAVCSSAEGLLVSTSGWTLRTGGFPRGVDLTGDSILVGISTLADRVNRHQMSSVLRRYTPSWFHTCDYLLEGVGMVLDIQPIDVDEAAVATLEPFFGFRRFPGTYNDAAPGNVYLPGVDDPRSGVFTPEWHGPESTHRWTAALDARMTLVVNPGESTVSITAMSGFPGAYDAEVYMSGRCIGRIGWIEPGARAAAFALPEAAGACELLFRVPHLWQPSAEDPRKLGVGIFDVTLR
ncbi:MAG: hypothetical protein ABSH09_32770 [Bryobacteraceae bacterium]|jgi:hypothetical protein